MRLFARYPQILEAIIKEAFSAGSAAFTESALRLVSVHRRFIEECEKAGIPRNDYPFNVENQGSRGLAVFLKQELVRRNLRKTVDAMHGEEAARRLGGAQAATRIGSRLECYQRVEFDGYRIDCIATIEVPDPRGGLPVFLPLERLWVLVVVDVTSRAVLGYQVCLNRHYSAEDVLVCFENAILPWKPRDLHTPGLSYGPTAGLPSGVIPELAYAKWGEVGIDNDKSNCAKWVWERVQDKIGCVICPGPVRTPERRQFVERFFRALAQNGFQRLPTTTGSGPDDPKRRDPEAMATKYRVTLENLLDLVDVLIADYNGLTTTALYNRSPLDYLRTSIEQKRFFIRQVPEKDRETFTLTLKRTTVTVRGNLKKGVRPYVRFEGVRYFSERLGNMPALIGKQVVIECNTRDLRVLRIYHLTGEEIDQIVASRTWAYQAHDLLMRKAILRCIRLGKLSRRAAADPVRSYIQAKTEEALAAKAKKPRNELAHAIRVKRQVAPPQPANATPINDLPLRRNQAPLVKIPALIINY